MRKLMWFTIGFGIASAVGAYVYPGHLVLLGIVFLLIGGVLAFAKRWLSFLRVTALISAAFSVGVFWFQLYDSFHLNPARSLDATYADVEFEVTDFSAATDYGSTVSAEITLDEHEYPVMVYLNDTLVCVPGDRLSGSFYLRFTSFGGEKTPTYHRGDGVFLLAYPNGEISHSKTDDMPLKYFPQKLRMQIIRKIESLFPSDAAAFAKALVLGDRSGIDYVTSTAFKVSGISHIVAVSGLHVSVLLAAVAFLFGRKRIILFAVGVPILLLFAAVTGFSPSVMRATIMQILFLSAMLINKEYDPPTALSAAALVMLIANPMVVISISFQLSFACMIGIFLFANRIYKWILDDNRLGSGKGKGFHARLKRWFAQSVAVTLSASVTTTPLVAVHFGTVSLVSVLTNLLVVWVICYIFYGVLIASAISLISMAAGRIAAWFVVWPIRFVLGTSKLLASFPLAAVYTESVYIVAWLVFAYILFGVFLCIRKKPVFIFSGLSAVCLCVCLIASWLEPLIDPCRLTVLDVGQGQCILLQSDGKTFLVDCGGNSDWRSADKAADTLLSQGISRIDGVIVTHYDKDHAGGVSHLLSRVSADTVYLPNIIDESGMALAIQQNANDRAQTVHEDIQLSFDSTKIVIFGPESYKMGNESSLCVLFQRENCDILITGDRGSLGEMLLLHRTQLPKLDVLVAGHHGSAGSTGEDLLKQTEPEYVLISVGKNNRYRHPSDKLLTRLEQFSCTVYRTDLHGTIIYRG